MTTTTNVLDQIAHRSHTRRLRDLAFSVLLAAVAAFSIGTISTAGSIRNATAAPAVAPASATQVVVGESCAIELGC